MNDDETMLEHELYTIIENAGNVVRIQLRPESAIFKAHFPGNPIMPGVCQVGIIGEVVETMCGCALTLREVKNLKFVEVMKPESVGEVVITFDKLEEDGNMLITKGIITSEEKTYTKFSLIFERV